MNKTLRTVCSIALVGAFAFGSIASGSSSSSSGSTAKVTKTESTTEATEEETEETLDLNNGYGLTVTFDKLEITFADSVEWTTNNNQFADYYDQDIIALTLHIKNTSDENHGLNMFYVKIFGSKGTELDEQGTYFDGDTLWSSGDLRPDAEQDITLYFPYDGDGTYYIDFDNFSEQVEIGFPITK